MEFLKIDGRNFYNMMVNASNSLEEKRDFVNSLNVFPVPDGDTGTNMSMTLKSAVNEINADSNSTLGEMSKVLARGALMGARGNSGVILSQIFRGIAKAFENKTDVNAKEFAACIQEGSNAAYKAVMRPTEGTILTIIRTAGETAVKSEASDITALLDEVCKSSEIMLNKTPDMLPVLKKAKVVDSGGMGLLIILKAMREALEKGTDFAINDVAPKSVTNAAQQEFDTSEIKYGYCTEFFVRAKNADIEKFKKELAPHGDSMVVVGVDDIIKVHIHSNDPGLILSTALKVGELLKVKVDNMREQHRHLIDNDTLVDENANTKETEAVLESEDQEKKKFAFIAVAMGEGIKNIFKDLGTDYVIEGGQTMNPSTQDILDCINKLNADNIFILPNNKNIIMAAKQAVDLTEKKVTVIETKTIPQGIAAMTAFNPDEELSSNVDKMSEAFQKVQTGQVTYAVRDTEFDGKTIKQNDILGLVNGKVSVAGKDIYEVAMEVTDALSSDDTELITVFLGKDVDKNKAKDFVENLEKKFTDADIQCYEGNQPLYYFIISAE